MRYLLDGLILSFGGDDFIMVRGESAKRKPQHACLWA